MTTLQARGAPGLKRFEAAASLNLPAFLRVLLRLLTIPLRTNAWALAAEMRI